MPKCPFCERTKNVVPLKEWNYFIYHVMNFRCTKCGNKFKAYFNNGNFSHTIPKIVSNKEKVLAYLRLNFEGSEEQISKTMNLAVEEVLNVLVALQKEERVAISA